MTIAILSCDSEMANSVPSNHEYLVGTLSKSISSHLVNSQIATETPPAQKSLHFLTNLVNLGSRNNLDNFLSSTGLPFCTSAHRLATDVESCGLDAPVAHQIPSLPVFHQIMMTLSPAFGLSLLIWDAGAPAMT